MSQKPFDKDSTKTAKGGSANIPVALSSHDDAGSFYAFMHTLPVMAHSIDREGVIQIVNEVWLTKMGYEREEVIGHKSTEFFTQESKEYAEKTVLPEFFAKESVENIPYQFVKKDGTIVYVLLSASSWKDQHGSFRGSVTTMCDITTLKQAENALKKNEALYKSAQRMGRVGHWEFDLKTGNIWGSEETRHIYGFDPAIENTTPAEIEKCIPERKRVRQALVDLIENGRPYNLEFEICPRTGLKRRYIKSIAELVVNESGVPEKVDGVVLDITHLKLADEKLRKSEERYRQLFNSIRDMILVVNTDRNIVDCNKTFKEGFGYSKLEIVGRKTKYICDSEEEYLKMGEKLKKHRGEKDFTYILNYKKKSGEVFPGETNVFKLQNDKGELVGFIGIVRDITYRKMVEGSLRKVNTELESKTGELEDTNTALKVLLKKRDQDNQELQENIYSNYELMVTPFLSKLKKRSADGNQQNLLDILETNLKEIVGPFAKKLSDPMMSLTSSEIQIANMIKQGYSNKEIATILDSSKRTVDTHRQNIRRKLKLNNEKVNLKTFLLNL